MSEHIDPAAALSLAALPKADPERRAAELHAGECPPCAELLRQGQALLLLLDGSEAPPEVTPALRARVEARLYGRPRAWMRWAALAAAMASFWLVVFDGKARGGLDLATGVHCVGFEAGFAALPLGVGLLLSRFGSVRLYPATFAAVTMSCAVVGQVLLRTRCEAHDLSVHLFVFHFLTVIVAGLSAAGSAAWLSVAPR